MINEYTKKINVAATVSVIVYTVVCIINVTVNYIFAHIDKSLINSIVSVFYAVSTVSILCYFYHTLTKEMKVPNRKRLLPFTFAPIAILSFVRGFISFLLDYFPSSEKTETSLYNFIGSFIQIGIAFSVYMLFGRRLVAHYVHLFYANRQLVFPAEYKLKNKWWFLLVSHLSVAVLSMLMSGLLISLVHFFNPTEKIYTLYNLINHTVLYIGNIGFTILFFILAFKPLKTLFYPMVITSYPITLIVGALFSLVTHPLATMWSAQTDSEASTLSIHTIILGGINFLEAVVALIITIILIKQSLIAFEQPSGLEKETITAV